MPAKTTKVSVSKPRGKGSQPQDDSDEEMELPRQEVNSNGQEPQHTNGK